MKLPSCGRELNTTITTAVVRKVINKINYQLSTNYLLSHAK